VRFISSITLLCVIEVTNTLEFHYPSVNPSFESNDNQPAGGQPTMLPIERRTEVLRLAHECGAFRSGNGEATKTTLRRFIACFGCSPEGCSMIWECLLYQGKLPSKAAPMHLFWLLYFLKVYPTESVAAVYFQCDEKTFRDWVERMARAVVSLDMVRSRHKRSGAILVHERHGRTNILTPALLGHRFGGKIDS
jgi:hypothetical protein